MLKVFAIALALVSCNKDKTVQTPGHNTYGTSGGVTPGAPQPSAPTAPGEPSQSTSGQTGAAGVTNGSASGSAAATKQHTH
ncbi:MAG: hypothetical protein JO257_30080 [Deltaproteobacteria bacterium]|nr:hypothetical protein [Deltaproteobacteria bacterium]